LGSPLPALAAQQPACSYPATKQGGSPALMQACSMQPKLQWHSSGIYMVFFPNTESNNPYNTAQLYHFYKVQTPENISAKTLHVFSYTSDHERISFKMKMTVIQ
jgi:hypothetical protein